MREIKFRGLTAKGEFAYGLLSKDLPNSTAYYDEYSYRICWHLESGGQANVPVKNGTIGQYTGLSDKNGVEIYESDVIELEDVRVEITFSDGAFQMITSEGQGKSQAMQERTKRFIVIGNVWENPELLPSTSK